MDIYLLHLETATKSCSVAVSVNGELIHCVESVDEQFSHGENLTLYIEKCLKEAKIKATDLQAISVSSGPGSYTGLRIGTSTAKGMCFALNIPMIAINSLRCIALSAKQKFPQKTLLAMIDARRMEAYTQIFDTSLIPETEIEATILNEDSFEAFLPFVAVGDGAEKTRDLWQNRKIVIDTENHSTAKSQCMEAYHLFLENKFVDLAYFEPYYLKDFVVKKSSK